MSDLVKWTRDLEKDYKGDGWPAVRMEYLTAMADRIEALESALRQAQLYLQGEALPTKTGLSAVINDLLKD